MTSPTDFTDIFYVPACRDLAAEDTEGMDNSIPMPIPEAGLIWSHITDEDIEYFERRDINLSEDNGIYLHLVTRILHNFTPEDLKYFIEFCRRQEHALLKTVRFQSQPSTELNILNLDLSTFLLLVTPAQWPDTDSVITIQDFLADIGLNINTFHVAIHSNSVEEPFYPECGYRVCSRDELSTHYQLEHAASDWISPFWFVLRQFATLGIAPTINNIFPQLRGTRFVVGDMSKYSFSPSIAKRFSDQDGSIKMAKVQGFVLPRCFVISTGSAVEEFITGPPEEHEVLALKTHEIFSPELGLEEIMEVLRSQFPEPLPAPDNAPTSLPVEPLNIERKAFSAMILRRVEGLSRELLSSGLHHQHDSSAQARRQSITSRGHWFHHQASCAPSATHHLFQVEDWQRIWNKTTIAHLRQL